MEGLQVLQYLVLDDCSSKANQLWIYLGLVHMAFQPLLCSTVGKYHLAWYAPQMGTGYYVPSFFVHFFAMFMPSLLFGGTYHRLVMGLVFVSGPLMTEYIMWGGSQDVRAHEWQGVWCLFSAAQVLGALGIEVISNGIAAGP
ncbi:hypothetical protein OEZ85_012050 [Tetradesmus obliquus]|uniref:Uncharacterized protein n=1 Tax=Tetradesmus obliquus TaxID=3088 RepID=A0ABY8TS55_TETOB|nr:hypothetical protein OEZ85_012050 [Tetradesmus obliquus]